MERVAFLIEESNQRLSCLLNPESLVLRREAGIQARRAGVGPLGGVGLKDDPLLFTGGGRTVLELDLLFDVELGGSSITTEDVRDLTRPLWNLAENAAADGGEGYMRPPIVRLVWGKSWNIPGVVAAVAERLERFTPAGLPRRSWMRMRLLRLSDPVTDEPPPLSPSPIEGAEVHEIIGGQGGPGEPELPVEGFITSNEILEGAMTETSAWQELAAAGRDVASATGDVISEVSLVDEAAEEPSTEGEEEEDPRTREKRRAVREIRDAVETVTSFMDNIASAAASEVVGAVSAAAEAMGSVTTSVATSTGRLETAGEASAAGTIRSAFRRIGSAVLRMAATAGRVAAVVREKSTAIIASAAHTMDATVKSVRAGVSGLGIMSSAAFDTAESLVTSATEIIGSTVGKVSSFGQTVAFEEIPSALEKMGTAVEVLWQAGSRIAVDVVSAAVEKLAAALKNATAAAEAIASVALDKAADAIRTAVETIRSTLAHVESLGSSAAAAAIRGALYVIRTMMAFLKARPEAAAFQPVSHSIETLEVAAEAIEKGEESPPDVSPALDAVAAAVEQVIQTESEVTAEMIKSAAGEAIFGENLPERPESPMVTIESDPTHRVQIRTGDRLDQIAYRFYRNPAHWRTIAAFNDIIDPLRLSPGRLVRIPPASAPSST
jgi:nucleoid-associated protein YgaU